MQVSVLTSIAGASGLPCLPAAQLEAAVLEQLGSLRRAPGMVADPQLHRYYHPNDIRQCDLDLAPPQTDPPF